MSEPAEIRLRRLRIRSWRRGTREMDLILGSFADGVLEALDAADLEAFEVLLSENDHDLYQWVTERVSIPPQYEEIVRRIRAHPPVG